jgi:hypothetical protein
VSVLSASNIALFPIAPSLSIISTLRMSVAGMLSGQPP